MLLVAFVLAVLGWAWRLRPPESPTSTPDRLAALGVLFAGGAFFLAVVGTIIAIVAYVNSTEKPILVLAEVSFPGRDEPLLLERGNEPFWGVASGWSVSIRLRNDGPVAARAVSVRIRMDGAAFVRPAIELEPWQARMRNMINSSELWWEGGADAVIHPGWTYDVVTLGPAPLRLSGPHQTFGLTIEVVADDVQAFHSEFSVQVERNFPLETGS